ncbi:barstar family protein [Xenorhabdus stockiae]|uniref:barstar family protein n=1 Tax=Xenorhabdus stockiae TaxID=351614 RepID=UPI004063B208
MKDLYYVFNSNGDMLFSCKELIECHDFSRSGYAYLFAFVGVSSQDIDFLLNGEIYTLKCTEFEERLDFDFFVRKIIKSEGVLYLYLEISNGMYKRGALSLLKSQLDDNDRIWLDMVRESKEIYISASYLFGGFRRFVEQDTIIVEGKYIHDYYSFYCEFGYAFFGKFGYMGSNLDAFRDCLVEIGRANRTITVIWKDSELSFKAIDNTVPSWLTPSFSLYMVMTIEEHCKLILK